MPSKEQDLQSSFLSSFPTAKELFKMGSCWAVDGSEQTGVQLPLAQESSTPPIQQENLGTVRIGPPLEMTKEIGRTVVARVSRRRR